MINRGSDAIKSHCFAVLSDTTTTATTTPVTKVGTIFNVLEFDVKTRHQNVASKNSLGDAICFYLEGMGTGVSTFDKVEVSSDPTFAANVVALDPANLDFADTEISKTLQGYKDYAEITNTEISRKIALNTSVFERCDPADYPYKYIRITANVKSASVGYQLLCKLDINLQNY